MTREKLIKINGELNQRKLGWKSLECDFNFCIFRMFNKRIDLKINTIFPFKDLSNYNLSKVQIFLFIKLKFHSKLSISQLKHILSSTNYIKELKKKRETLRRKSSTGRKKARDKRSSDKTRNQRLITVSAQFSRFIRL